MSAEYRACNIIAVAILSVGLISCGGSGEQGNNSGTPINTSPEPTPVPTTQPEVPDNNTPLPQPTSTPPPEPPSSPEPTPRVEPGEGSFIIESSSPTNNAVRRSLTTEVVIDFNTSVISETLNENSIYVTANGQRIAHSLRHANGESAVTLVFSNMLTPNQDYQVNVSDELMSSEGERFAGQIITFTTASNIGLTSQSVIDECMSDFDMDMLNAVNAARAQPRMCGEQNHSAVPALAWSCLIENAALGHTQDMATNNFFSHTGSSGSDLSQRINETGYQWRSIAENIAVGFRSIDSVMQGWIDSPGHCSNIMRDSVTEFGAAEIDNYWTQNFARPR